MKTFLKIILVFGILFSAVSARIATAANFIDDFSGGINTDHWTVNAGAYTIDDTQGDIRMSKPAGGGAWGSIWFNHEVRGDFDISADYRDAVLGPNWIDQIQLNLSFGGQYVGNRRECCGHRYSVWLDPPGTTVGATDTSDTSGTLRVTRVGSTVTVYANATQIYQGNFNSSPVTDLWLSLQNNGTEDALSVTFDNFSITADGIDVACTPPPSGMVSWWGGDNNALDMVGTNNGTLVGGAAYAPGKVGQAFSLAGTGDYVNAGTNTNFNFNNGAGDFTIDAWINLTAHRPVSIFNASSILNKYTVNPFSGWGLYIYPDGKLGFGGAGVWEFVSAVGTITTGNWTHVVVTKQGSTYRMYKNGAEIASTSYGNLQTSTSPLKIGSDLNGLNANGDLSDNRFNGLIDEVEIFNRALDATEIAVIYNAGSAGKCRSCTPPATNVVSWWGGDNNALDMIGANNGTLQNGATYAPGMVGQSFSFDANSASVRVPHSGSLDIGTGHSVDFWIKLNALPVNNAIVFDKWVSGVEDKLLAIAADGTIGYFLFQGFGGSGLPSNMHLTAGVWHHIAATYDGANAGIYIDGNLDASKSVAGVVANSTGDLYIGFNPLRNAVEPYYASLNGSLDEFTWHNVALSATDIARIYNAGSAGKCRTCAAPPADMVSWWKGDGNTADAVGTNHGTLQGGATYASGKVGQAFSFDGVDDLVVIPHNVDQNTGSQITIDAWVNLTTSGHGRSIVQKRSSSNVGGYIFETTHSPSGPDNGLAFCLWIGGSANCVNTVANVFTLGTWHHVAATYDGTNAKIYVDDIEKASASISGTIDAVTDPLSMGRNVVAPSFAWHGLIDEVEIFNRALSSDEIGAIYNAGSAGKCFTADTAPAPITFNPVTGAGRSTLYTSNTIIISGINVPAEIAITGGAYSVGCTATFISTPSTVVNGNTVCVQQTSSPNYSTPTKTTLTIGTVSGDFDVTTMASHILDAVAVPSAAKTFNPSSWEIGEGGNIGINIEPNAAYYFVSATDNCGAGGAQNGNPYQNNASYSVPEMTADCTVTVTYAAYPVWRDGTTEYFMKIFDAYGDGNTPYTIKAHGVDMTDNGLPLLGTADLVLDGGYQADFTLGYSGSPTVITGPLTIGGTGGVTINNIAVK